MKKHTLEITLPPNSEHMASNNLQTLTLLHEARTFPDFPEHELGPGVAFQMSVLTSSLFRRVDEVGI